MFEMEMPPGTLPRYLTRLAAHNGSRPGLIIHLEYRITPDNDYLFLEGRE